MKESVIEIVKLANGDIALRHADDPHQNLVTISFSQPVQDMLQGMQLHVGHSMLRAGMDTFKAIQLENLQAAERAAAQGLLH
ncbi:MAG: hypothetical protein HKN50_01510 [Gammaproteobacteria bacterium]|nr:hypothetical protein [Gammaproteobacteria bacterium]